MAVLKKILVQNFRNIGFAEIEFSEGINCICGDNGQGKTNLLDAVYYLSMTKSAFGIPDHLCTRYGCDGFSIAGNYVMHDGLLSHFCLSVKDGVKQLRRDEKTLPGVTSHIGVLPVAVISPFDGGLVSEGGEERRRFVNSVLSQMNAEYLVNMVKYNRLLAQRNRLLKDSSIDWDLMGVIDDGMSESAGLIYRERKAFADKLKPVVDRYYALLSGCPERVDIKYASDLDEGRDLKSVLAGLRRKEQALGFTCAGIQREDFLFEINGYPMRRCGSQGQQKSFLVALKLAQYDIMREGYGFAPLLLLDDVFDKLDFSRMSNLLKLVSSGDYGQIFITDTNMERMERLVGEASSDALYINTLNGEFQTGKN